MVHYYSYVFCSRKDDSCGQCLFSDGIDLSLKDIGEMEKTQNLQKCLVAYNLGLVRRLQLSCVGGSFSSCSEYLIGLYLSFCSLFGLTLESAENSHLLNLTNASCNKSTFMLKFCTVLLSTTECISYN